MTSTVTNKVEAAALIALALAIGAMGVYVAEADDAPGAAVIGLLLMIGAVVLGVKAARNRLPAWAARTALAVGVLIAAFAAFLIHTVAVTAPLFAQPEDVPSVIDSAPLPQYAAAVERARELVRAAILEQNLPGVSVAVGLPSVALAKEGGTIVWAEGFGCVNYRPKGATRFRLIGGQSLHIAPTVLQVFVSLISIDDEGLWSLWAARSPAPSKDLCETRPWRFA
jgi:hypothetical protein